MRNIQGLNVLDSLDEFVDPKHAAVIVVDMQNDFCHADGLYKQAGKDISAMQASVPGVVAFVEAAQKHKVPVAFIRQITLPGGLSDSPAWLRFKCRDGKSPQYTLQGSWGSQLVDGLNPGPNDVVVEKFRPDAFHRTSLDGLLRARGIQSLIILGNATEGCVESTVRGGSYHDYYVTVVKDLVSSPNPVLHEGSLRLFEARYPMADAEQIKAIWEERS
jgi:ureidoacrylate peracid hydrolase